jgi:glycosyltransferase involved in cell wall biosynthesis
MHKASVIIPAYNEEEKIGELIKRIRKLPGNFEIIVVDDASTDRTAETVKKEKATIISNPKNQGKAYSCKIGAAAAKSHKLVFIDADLQLQPEDIPKFVEALKGCDLAIGRRNFRKVPLMRRASNFAAKKLIGQNDALCGLRAIRKKDFISLGLKKDRYEFESEMLLRAKSMRMKICEIPVGITYASGKGMGLADSLKVFWFILKKRLGE